MPDNLDNKDEGENENEGRKGRNSKNRNRDGRTDRLGSSRGTDDLAEKIYSLIQGKCLWQFFPREWDRKENIEGIMGMAAELIVNPNFPQPEKLVDKYYYVEAKLLVSDIKKEFPQVLELGENEKRELMEKVKQKLLEVMVLKSINPELRLSSY